MERSTNALAELASTLCGIEIDKAHYKTVGECVDAMNAMEKAQRIIAELAKANTLVPKHGPVDISLYRAYKLYKVYENCRAIAEEGAGDGK